jgi:hypothetical protein
MPRSLLSYPSLSRRDFVLGSAAALASGPLMAQMSMAPDNAGGFAGRDDVRAFCGELASAHGFDQAWLLNQFEPVQPQPKVIELIRPPTKPGVRSWQRYRGRFVEPLRIREGRAFMTEHAATLERAELQYGVPRQVVTAIIGVETIYATPATSRSSAHWPRWLSTTRHAPTCSAENWANCSCSRATRTAMSAATAALTPAPSATRNSCPAAGAAMRSISTATAASI